MRLPRGRDLWILVGVFAISAVSRGSGLLLAEGPGPGLLFDSAGIGAAYVPLVSVIVLLDLLSLWFIYRPAPFGWTACLASIALSVVEVTTWMLIGFANPDLLRQILDGDSADPGLVEAMTPLSVFVIILVVSLVISAIWTILVVRNRGWFEQGRRPANATEARDDASGSS